MRPRNKAQGGHAANTGNPGLTSRRSVLVGGTVGVGAWLTAGLLPEGVAGAAGPPAGCPDVPDRGPARTIVWANGAIADWNLDYDVGSNDAARLVGWHYKKVGMPQTTYSASQVLQVLNEVIQLRPDVMITPDWVEGEGALMAEAQKRGIFVVVNNAVNFPDQLRANGIASVTSNPNILGQKSAAVLVQELASRGKKSGTIIIGNPYPQNPNQQGIVVGAEQVINAWNTSHGTHFSPVELADNSGSNLAGAVSLWKAKITQVGSSLVAGLAIADSSTQAAVRAYQQSGFRASEIPLAAVDTTSQSLVELQQGWVLCVVDQGFYMQGWLPVMFAWQALERGFYPSGEIDASGSAITKATLGRYQQANSHQISLGKQYGVVLS